MEQKSKLKSSKRKYAKPVSLYPLTPEQAIYGIMNVDPKKIRMRERKAKKND